MSNPRIGYNNLFDTANSIVASSEAAGFEKENIYDWLTFDFWKPLSVPAYLTLDMLSATTADYFAIAAHDIATQGATVKLQYSTDNFAADVNTAVTFAPTADNRALFESFVSQNKRYWRIEMSAAICSLGVAVFGDRLDIPEGMRPGFTPPTMSFEDEVLNNRSNGGAFIGRSLKRKGISGRMAFDLLTAAWVRANWLPFLEHARIKPFILSWNEGDYPNEAAYCWTDGKITPPNHALTNFMNVALDYKGIVE